jgi:AAA15 family ATPase/GTPase
MLIRFTVENFLSFKKRVEFSMIPGKGRKLSHHLIKREKPKDISVLKTGVLYGANAAGKSNVIKAMDFAKQLITKGTSPDKVIPIKPFKLDEAYLKKPSRFEFEFKQNGKTYAYGFSLNSQWILEEWLYEINSVDEKPIFERQTVSDEQVIVTPGASLSFSNEEQAGVFKYTGNMATRPNQLFLAEMAKINTKKLKIAALIDSYQWFDKVLTIIFPETRYAGFAFEAPVADFIQADFVNFLTAFDTGISGIQTIEMDFDNQLKALPETVKNALALELVKGEYLLIWTTNNIPYIIFRKDSQIKAIKLMTKHSTKEKQETLFELGEESEGTQRLIDLIPALITLFNNEKVFVIDELERSLHPTLTKTLLALFLTHSQNVKSQLIVTTHEAELLDLELLRPDEIWFVEKSKAGESSVYSLEEFKTNYGKNWRQGYLLGRFGAVPMIKNRLLKSQKVDE